MALVFSPRPLPSFTLALTANPNPYRYIAQAYAAPVPPSIAPVDLMKTIDLRFDPIQFHCCRLCMPDLFDKEDDEDEDDLDSCFDDEDDYSFEENEPVDDTNHYKMFSLRRLLPFAIFIHKLTVAK